MLAFWINYGSLLHMVGDTMYIVPLTMQMLPALLLLGSQLLCNESPRWLARQDRWEDARRILSTVRQLPSDHPYVAGEIQEIWDQLEHERNLIGDAKFKDLMREMWTIPGNRKRALISVGLMICQQMTGLCPLSLLQQSRRTAGTNAQLPQAPTRSTTTPLRSSPTWV